MRPEQARVALAGLGAGGRGRRRARRRLRARQRREAGRVQARQGGDGGAERGPQEQVHHERPAQRDRAGLQGRRARRVPRGRLETSRRGSDARAGRLQARLRGPRLRHGARLRAAPAVGERDGLARAPRRVRGSPGGPRGRRGAHPGVRFASASGDVFRARDLVLPRPARPAAPRAATRSRASGGTRRSRAAAASGSSRRARRTCGRSSRTTRTSPRPSRTRASRPCSARRTSPAAGPASTPCSAAARRRPRLRRAYALGTTLSMGLSFVYSM